MKALYLIISFLLLHVSFSIAQYTKIDSTFGTEGRVVTDIHGSASDFPFASALQHDGKILVAGMTAGLHKADFFVLRYSKEGVLDDSFGENGIVQIDFNNTEDRAYALIVQPDEKIVVAGESGNNSNSDVAVVRLLPDGNPDTTFGVQGKVITDLGTTFEHANALALQKDGKIVAAGRVASGNFSDFVAIRYLKDGKLDPDFGDAGISKINVLDEDEVRAVAIQGDDKILLAGYASLSASGDFALVRLNPDGTPDKFFGNGGRVTTDIAGRSDLGTKMLILPDGKIIISGNANNNFFNGTSQIAMVQYDKDGILDPSFGVGGIALEPSEFYNDVRAFARQPNGKLLVAGAINNGTPDQTWLLERFQPDGALDTLFGSHGIVTSDYLGNFESAAAMVIQNDSRIVLAGNSGMNTNYDIVLERYIADFTLSATATNVHCYGQDDGSITVEASGGVPPYEYSLDGVFYQSENTINGLPEGAYTITIRDSNGAGVTGSIGPVAILNPPVPPSVSVETIANSIMIHVEGNPSGFLYSIDNGVTFQSDSTFSDLLDGDYTIVVLDTGGCYIFNMTVTIHTTAVTPDFNGVRFEIAPNPGVGLFNLKLNANAPSVIQINIIDVSGRLVYTAKSEMSAAKEIQLDLQYLNKGCYFLRIEDGNKSGLKKIMIIN